MNKMTPLLILLGISLLGLILCDNLVHGDFTSIGFGGRVAVTEDETDYITNIALETPLPNGTTTPTWEKTGANWGVRLTVNVTGIASETYWCRFYNRTGGGNTLITGVLADADLDGYAHPTYLWAPLGLNTLYRWSVNISHNSSGQYELVEGYWQFTTKSVYPVHNYYTVSFGGRAVVDEEEAPSNYYTVSFGGRVVVTEEEPSGGWTSNSTWWEFYQINYTRYNVFEPDINSTDTFDVYAVYSEVYYSEPYDYLYDVFEQEYTTVDSFDVYRVFYYAYYGEDP